jgi:hypothetical protein
MYFHEQADSGLGYTVDKKIVGIVRAFNRIPGLYSFCSCEKSKLGTIWIEFEADKGASSRMKRALKIHGTSVVWKLTWTPWGLEARGLGLDDEFDWKDEYGNLHFDQTNPEIIENVLDTIAKSLR